MKSRAIVFLILMLSYVSTANSLTIKEPPNNSIFITGQKIKVVVEPDQNEDIAGIFVHTTPKSSSGSRVLLNPPYEFELKLDDQYVGRAKIKAIARLKDDTAVETGIDITVQLPPNVKLEKILVDKSDSIMKSAAGQPFNTRKLWVLGLFTDGIQREINATYSSSDPNVISVDNNGVITALNLGRAIITVTAEDKSETMDVMVYVNIDLDSELLIKPTETGIQLNWKISPQDPEWVTSYYVFRSDDPDGIVKKKMAEVPNGVASYLDTKAEKGKTYYYSVQAVSSTAKKKSDMTTLTPGTLP